MSRTTEIRRTVDDARAALADPKPLHAVAGAGDILVERLRLAAIAERKALRALMSSTADNLRAAIVGFPDLAQDAAASGAAKASHTYDDLADRGSDLVRRISRQRASQLLADQLQNTARAAKATSTSARHAASAATAAVTAAAAKTGTTAAAATSRTRKDSAPSSSATTATKAPTRTTKATTAKSSPATTSTTKPTSASTTD